MPDTASATELHPLSSLEAYQPLEIEWFALWGLTGTMFAEWEFYIDNCLLDFAGTNPEVAAELAKTIPNQMRQKLLLLKKVVEEGLGHSYDDLNDFGVGLSEFRNDLIHSAIDHFGIENDRQYLTVIRRARSPDARGHFPLKTLRLYREYFTETVNDLTYFTQELNKFFPNVKIPEGGRLKITFGSVT